MDISPETVEIIKYCSAVLAGTYGGVRVIKFAISKWADYQFYCQKLKMTKILFEMPGYKEFVKERREQKIKLGTAILSDSELKKRIYNTRNLDDTMDVIMGEEEI